MHKSCELLPLRYVMRPPLFFKPENSPFIVTVWKRLTSTTFKTSFEYNERKKVKQLWGNTKVNN